MHRVGYVLGALLLLVCVAAPAFAQQPFADVPLNHWAYNAVNGLAEQGVMEGYPDGYFKGKQRLTRYEFAQAIARLVDRMEEMGGVQGAPGPPGPPGPPGTAAAGLTPEQQALIDRLAKEFGPELKALRSDLDSLTSRVEDLEAAPKAELPTITVSGDISWRVGLYGTSLGIEDVEGSGYPFFEELIGGGEPYYYLDGAVSAAQGGFGTAVAPYGGINIPFYDAGAGMWSDDAAYAGGPVYNGTIPISDALKDSYKASDFMTQRTRVNFSGQLADDTCVNVTLLAGPEGNDVGSPMEDYYAGSPLILSGNGVMDTVAVDEAWLMHSTRVVAPADLTIGKQYVSRGQGLLADNSQEALKAIRVDWDGSDSLSWGAFLGMLDREQFYGLGGDWVGIPPLAPAGSGLSAAASGQDNYHLYYLDWAVSDNWALGANWLETGFNQEQGWSADLEGTIWDLDFYGEYAQLTDWPNGEETSPTGLELDESDNAWMAGLRWSTPAVCVTGEYGEVDAGYAYAFSGGGWSVINPLISGFGMYTDYLNLPLSALHPNAEVDPHYINWIDRPLFLDPTNIAKGWHVNVTFPELLGSDTPVSVSYMDGDSYEPRYLQWLAVGGPTSGVPEPDKWTDADSVWVVKVSRQLSDSVSANILYGRREVDNVMSPQTVPLYSDGETTYYAENEPIQVLRAEVCVAF